jgi:hypothetical protein
MQRMTVTPVLSLVALIAVLCTQASYSQTLNWGSLTNSTIVDSQGMPLDEMFVFELGAFDPGFNPSESNIGQWADHWNVFDAASYAYNPTDLGYFTGTTHLQDVPGYTGTFEGLGAFLWVRNNGKTEQFLSSTASWTFPTLDPGCCPTAVTTWSVSDLATDTPVWGSHDELHGGGNYFAPGPFDLQTHAIPEPGSWVMVLVGCGTLFLHRRRRSR